jgi:hypothetical protein
MDDRGCIRKSYLRPNIFVWELMLDIVDDLDIVTSRFVPLCLKYQFK